MEDAGESVPANSTNSTEQAASSEDTGESAPANSTNSTEITVSADTDETPYILLAFENTVTEAQIKKQPVCYEAKQQRQTRNPLGEL